MGQLKLQIQETDIVGVCVHVLNKFPRWPDESRVQLNLSQETPIPPIEADADRIEQVLTNLVDNALRHTPDGGTITVRLRALGEEKCCGSGGYRCRHSEEDLPFVFERFYKIDKARTRGKTGTGLGLAIVKNIIEAHGGIITAKSQVGKGTTFSIVLPVEHNKKKRHNGHPSDSGGHCLFLMFTD